MPGTRLSSISRKADVVVVAARYGVDRLVMAQAYLRHGAVWGDVVLLDRPALIDRIRGHKHVMAGRPRADLPGDFEVEGELQYNGNGLLTLRGRSSGRDDLGVPLF